MSSSYSSLDWVLSHWAYLTVHRFIYVCFFDTAYTCMSYCSMVGLKAVKPNPSDPIPLQCFDAVRSVI